MTISQSVYVYLSTSPSGPTDFERPELPHVRWDDIVYGDEKFSKTYETTFATPEVRLRKLPSCRWSSEGEHRRSSTTHRSGPTSTSLERAPLPTNDHLSTQLRMCITRGSC